MEAIRNTLSDSLNYLMTIRFSDAIDILIVAYIIYKAIGLVRKTSSSRLARGILVLAVALWLSSVFQLTMINFILRRTMEVGLIAIVIIFQPELRRLLEKIGSGDLYRSITARGQQQSVVEAAVTQTVLACADMSDSRTGALIVFERNSKLIDQMRTGTVVNSDVTAELMKNLFYNKAPLHDGAVIIRDGRIAAAGCVLPLSKSINLSKDLGMRHRAGIGMSEASDAIVTIVSEETGSISVAENGMLKRHLTPASLETLLREKLLPESEDDWRTRLMKWLSGLFAKKKEEGSDDE